MAAQGNDQFTVIERKRVSHVVMDQIKQLLSDSKLNIGDRLPPERQLAKQLGVSRAPVREALFSLANSGFLEIRRGAGGGNFVSEPSVEPYVEFFTLMLQMGKASVRDLTEARLFLEPNVARVAAKRATSEDLKNIERSISEYEKRVDRDAPRNLGDMKFHVHVAEASKNIVMVLTLKGLMGLLYKTVKDFSLSREDKQKSTHTHRKIFEAIRTSDSESASKLMAEHVKEMAVFWK
jgi:GntR family transcriptional regulator, transcriptional repressor for pyruvate dehydrogenase complex